MNNILIPRRLEERKQRLNEIEQRYIQQYIENGSKGDIYSDNISKIYVFPDNLVKINGDLIIYSNSNLIDLNNLEHINGDLISWYDKLMEIKFKRGLRISSINVIDIYRHNSFSPDLIIHNIINHFNVAEWKVY